jgi:carboxymethylenebutenolidase
LRQCGASPGRRQFRCVRARRFDFVGGYPGDDKKGAAAFRQVDGKKMTEDFVAAAKWLKTRKDSSGKLGAVGFCFGGGMVNQLAVRLGADLNAGVAFYGRQAGVDDVPKISAPLLLRYVGNDQRVNEGIAAYEAALKANKKMYEVYLYEGKQHGFHNDTTPRYDEAAAKWPGRARSSGSTNTYGKEI